MMANVEKETNRGTYECRSSFLIYLGRKICQKTDNIFSTLSSSFFFFLDFQGHKNRLLLFTYGTTSSEVIPLFILSSDNYDQCALVFSHLQITGECQAK